MSDVSNGLEHVNGDARQFYESAVKAASKTADQLRRADRQLLDHVRERPLVAVAAAMAAGYLLGRIFSRFG